jgi:hypothetical protein
MGGNEGKRLVVFLAIGTSVARISRLALESELRDRLLTTIEVSRRQDLDSTYYPGGLVVRALGYRSGLGSLSLVSTTEELLDRKVAACLENRKYGRRDPSRRPRGTLYPQKLAITSPTSGGR